MAVLNSSKPICSSFSKIYPVYRHVPTILHLILCILLFIHSSAFLDIFPTQILAIFEFQP